MSDFYDEMFERLEEAKDRAVLARWRTICPLMPEKERMEMWLALVKQTNRVEARTELTRWFDIHDSCVSLGLGPALAPNGDPIDMPEE